MSCPPRSPHGPAPLCGFGRVGPPLRPRVHTGSIHRRRLASERRSGLPWGRTTPRSDPPDAATTGATSGQLSALIWPPPSAVVAGCGTRSAPGANLAPLPGPLRSTPVGRAATAEGNHRPPVGVLVPLGQERPGLHRCRAGRRHLAAHPERSGTDRSTSSKHDDATERHRVTLRAGPRGVGGPRGQGPRFRAGTSKACRRPRPGVRRGGS
jgi:hypothetical protein